MFRDEDEWNLLPVIFNTVHLAFQVEVHRERGNVFDLEGLLRGFTEKHVAERDDSIFGSDFDFRPHTNAFQ